MAHKCYLPKKDGEAEEYSTENNALVIIGANGSGKSKLGAWIEEQDLENIHRISAQRSLNFDDYITLKSREQAENELFYGHEKFT